MPTNDYLPYLQHHGILGMKWGVRRYQNEDGSYTPLGRQHRGLTNKEAKRMSKSLNTLDSNRAILEGDRRERKKKYDAISKAFNSAKSKDKNHRKLDKLSAKKNLAKMELDSVSRSISALDASIKKNIAYAQKNGANVSIKKIKRSTLSSGEKFARWMLFGNLTPIVLSKSYVSGNKYSVKQTKLLSNKSDSSVTKRVKSDYNRMTDKEFKAKYKTSKNTYKKRVDKYGDPYKHGTLAKIGRRLGEK